MGNTDNTGQGLGRERRLAAILLTDIVGYSKKMSDDEESALRMLERHNAALLPLIGKYNGRVLKTMGDAILAEFRSVVEAVKCSLAIQSELKTMNEAVPEEQRFEVRIGIHVGDVIVTENGDLFGDGVNIVARIQPLAEPGGVCISSVVHSQIKNMPEFMSVSMGRKHLKNIPEAVEVLSIQPSKGGVRRVSGKKLKVALLAAAVLAIAAASGFYYSRHRSSGYTSGDSGAYLYMTPEEVLAAGEKCSARMTELSREGKDSEAVALLEKTVDMFPEILEGDWPPEMIGRAVPMLESWSDYTGRLLNRKPGLLDAVRVEGKLLFRMGDDEGAFAALEDACSMGDAASCAMLRERTDLLSD